MLGHFCPASPHEGHISPPPCPPPHLLSSVLTLSLPAASSHLCDSSTLYYKTPCLHLFPTWYIISLFAVSFHNHRCPTITAIRQCRRDGSSILTWSNENWFHATMTTMRGPITLNTVVVFCLPVHIFQSDRNQTDLIFQASCLRPMWFIMICYLCVGLCGVCFLGVFFGWNCVKDSVHTKIPDVTEQRLAVCPSSVIQHTYRTNKSYWPVQHLAHAFPGDGAVNAHFGEEPLFNSKEPAAQKQKFRVCHCSLSLSIYSHTHRKAEVSCCHWTHLSTGSHTIYLGQYKVCWVWPGCRIWEETQLLLKQNPL